MFSLVESQLILPSHLAHRRTRSKHGEPNPFVAALEAAFQSMMSGGLESASRVNGYGRLARLARSSGAT